MVILTVAIAGRWDQRILWVFCLAIGAQAGWADSQWQQAPVVALPDPFEGRVHQIRQRGDRYHVIVSPDASPTRRVQMRTVDREAGLAPGARVRVYGSTRRLRPADNPGGFDALAHGRNEGVVWRNDGHIWVLRRASPLDELGVGLQDDARERLNRSSRDYGARILSGLLLGDRAGVPESTRSALQTTGAAHLMAVSGLHVGGLALLVFGLVRRCAIALGSVRPWRWAALLALPPTGLFVVLAGAPASAVRAGVMVTVYLVGVLLGRRTRALDALAVAAVLLATGNPWAADNVGFQLSFVAVAALLIFAAGQRGVAALAITALVASLATAPVQAWHFGTVAPLGPVANLLLSPLAAMVVVPLGLMGLLWAPLTTFPLDLAAGTAEALSAIAETMATWSDGPWVVGRWTASIWMIPMVVVWSGWRRRWRLGIMAVGVLVSIGLWQRPTADAVDFVAVGQGDAIVLRSGGRAALVDAGPQKSAFALGNYLRKEGIGRLEWALVTHGHPDHFLGLTELAKTIDIGAVWFNGHPNPGPAWLHLRRHLDGLGIPVIRAPTGHQQLGRLRLTVMPPLIGSTVEENDASIAMVVRGAAASVLLTGDLEAAGEAALLDRSIPRVDVLQAPHHGSRTSSGRALLRATCPRSAVYSVGHGNRYGLPHPTVVDRYARFGIPVWRTDEDGRVRIRVSTPARIEAFRRRPVALEDLPQSCTRPLPRVALPFEEPRS